MINKCYYVTVPSAATSTTLVNPPSSTAAGVLQLQTTATQPSLLGLSTQHQRYTSSSYPMPSSSVTGRLAAGVPNCNEYQLWLFVVIGLTVIFAVLIVVLFVICVWLCVLKSRTTSIACVEGFSMQTHSHDNTLLYCIEMYDFSVKHTVAVCMYS